MTKIIKVAILIFFFIYVTTGITLFIFQKDLVYYPNKQDFDSCLGFEDSQKINVNGTRMYFRKNNNKLIVFYHGNAGSACDRTHLKNKFEELGLSYLFVEYYGYSNALNKPTKKLLIKDVENVNEFLNDKNFSETTIMGESLGTALAIHHSTIVEIDKLLLISPFFSMAEVAKNSLKIYPTSPFLKENYESYKWIKNSKAKKLKIIHGNIDDLVPIKQSKELYKKVLITNKEYVEVDGANHNDIYNFEETSKNINQFLVK